MLKNLLFEFSILFSSLVIEVNNISFQTIKFLGLGTNDSSVDLSSGIEITFKLSFKSYSLTIAVSKILIVDNDIGVARLLVILMGGIILFLFSDISVLEVTQSAQKSV
jgi:hypothetical protein